MRGVTVLVLMSVAVEAFTVSSSVRPSFLWATRATEDVPSSASSSVQRDGSPDMKAFSNGYKTVYKELPFQKCEPSVGSVPEDLVGSYFKAGPAMFSAGSIVPPKKSIVQPRQPPVPDGTDMDRMVKHPFEGDGAVLGVTFSKDGSVSARFRFVRTVAFTAERKKGAKTYTGMEATRDTPSVLGNDLPIPLFRHHLLPGLNKKRKNTSNTRAIFWGKRLMSLWEGGQPYKLDGRALSTDGRSRLGGAIPRDEDPFGSKMSFDSFKDRALFYGVDQGAKKSEITIYEFDAAFKLINGGRQSFDLPGFVIVNDFCTTENFSIVVAPNLEINAMQFMVGKDPGKTLSLGDGPALLHLIPRADSKQSQVVSLPVPSDGVNEANLQFCNAYEDGAQVIFDAFASIKAPLSKSRPWPWGDSLESYRSMASSKSLWRYTVDQSTGAVSKRQLSDTHGFFGTINQAYSSQKHRYIYYNVGSLGAEVAPPQGIARFDCETEIMSMWFPENYEFCGEPMYAPKQGHTAEDSGYILSTLYNGRDDTSELIILEASNIQAGPITRIPLGITIPHGLFGCFSDDEAATWTADSLERRAKLADKMESRGNQWNEVKSDFSGLGLRFDDMEEYFGDFFN